MTPSALSVLRLQDAVDRLTERHGVPEPTADVLALLDELRHVQDDKLQESAAHLMAGLMRVVSWYGVPLARTLPALGLKPDLAALPASWWDADPAEALERVMRAGRTVARTTDVYRRAQGGPVRPEEALQSVLPTLLFELARLFPSPEALREHVDITLRALADDRCDQVATSAHASRDGVRSPALLGMRHIAARTMCPFAASSRLWAAPNWDVRVDVADNVEAALPMLRSFCTMLPSDPPDGFVFAVPTDVVDGTDHHEVALLVRALLGALYEATGVDGPRTFSADELRDPSWRLFLFGEQFFISVFAACYPEYHSRYSYLANEHVLFLLQPEAAIHLNISHDSYDERADGIRQRFVEAFQPYHLADIEAHRFLPHPRRAASPVAWYDLPVQRFAVDATRRSDDV